jgi:phytoene synthase
MSVQIYPWESRLIAMAHEAMQQHKHHPTSKIETKDVHKAYRYCDQITRQHSQTFYLATALLPYEKRRSMRALYAFCRVTDNLVDGNPDTSMEAVEDWRTHSLNAHPPEDDLVAYAWAHTRAKFSIPRQLGDQLIDGVAQDLTKKRYQSFDELAAYCYRVASTVGLMAMHIIGFKDTVAIPYAIKLGVALQLTNILRDVGEDWKSGRLYLPLDELAQFGITETDIAAGQTDERWLNFLKFQIRRNRKLYLEAMPGICRLHSDGRLAVTAAAKLYAGILDVILVNRGNVFTRRAAVGAVEKLAQLPSIWWQSMHCRINSLLKT